MYKVCEYLSLYTLLLHSISGGKVFRITACRHDISGSTPGVCMEKLPIDLCFPAGTPNDAGESIARSKLLEWGYRGRSSTI